MAGPAPSPELEQARAHPAFVALQERFRLGLVARWNDIAAMPAAAPLAGPLHRLAGAAGSFGFDPLGQAARRAERLAAEGDAAALPMALAQLHGQVVRVVPAALHGNLLPPAGRSHSPDTKS